MKTQNWMLLQCTAVEPAAYRRDLITWATELLNEVLEGEADGGIELESDETYTLSVLGRFRAALDRVPEAGDPPGMLAVAVPYGAAADYAADVARAIGAAVQHLLDRERLRLGAEAAAALRGMIACQALLQQIGKDAAA
jgi:hypothetical protein